MQPNTLSPIFENFPSELTSLNQWVLWKWQNRDGKWTKPPFSPVSFSAAQVNNPETWGSFSQAKDAYLNKGGFDGVGFVLTRENHFTGIDLDHVVSDSGEISQEASDIVNAVQTYTEYSPSGSGIRMFAIGSLPDSGRRKGNFEFYESGRYLTVTGNLLNENSRIEHRERRDMGDSSDDLLRA